MWKAPTGGEGGRGAEGPALAPACGGAARQPTKATVHLFDICRCSCICELCNAMLWAREVAFTAMGCDRGAAHAQRLPYAGTFALRELLTTYPPTPEGRNFKGERPGVTSPSPWPPRASRHSPQPRWTLHASYSRRSLPPPQHPAPPRMEPYATSASSTSRCPAATARWPACRSCLHAGLPHEGGTNNLDAYTRWVDCKP